MKERIFLVQLRFEEGDDIFLSYPDNSSFSEDFNRLNFEYGPFTYSTMFVSPDDLSFYLGEYNTSEHIKLKSGSELLAKKLSVLEKDYQRLNNYLHTVDRALDRIDSKLKYIDYDSVELVFKEIGYLQGQLDEIYNRAVYTNPESLYLYKVDSSSDDLPDELPFG